MDIEIGFSNDPAEVGGLRRPARPRRGRQPRGPAHRPGPLRAGARRRHGPRNLHQRADRHLLARRRRGRRTLARADAYVHAGADGIFVPGVKDEGESRGSPRRSPSRSTSSTSRASPSPGWPSSASPASAPARCSTGSRSAPRSTPPAVRDGAPGFPTPRPTRRRRARYSEIVRRSAAHVAVLEQLVRGGGLFERERRRVGARRLVDERRDLLAEVVARGPHEDVARLASRACAGAWRSRPGGHPGAAPEGLLLLVAADQVERGIGPAAAS